MGTAILWRRCYENSYLGDAKQGQRKWNHILAVNEKNKAGSILFGSGYTGWGPGLAMAHVTC